MDTLEESRKEPQPLKTNTWLKCIPQNTNTDDLKNIS